MPWKRHWSIPARRAAGLAWPMRVGALDEHIQRSAEQIRTKSIRQLTFDRLQRLAPLRLDPWRHIVAQTSGPRTLTRAVREDVDARKADLAGHPARLGEVLVRLARKADDDVRAERGHVQFGADASNTLE